MAKYHEIAMALMKQIVNGKHSEQGKLPTEKELSAQFQTSRNTIRSALQLLADEGYVYRVQGSGVYLRPTNFDESINLNVIKAYSSEQRAETCKIKLLTLERLPASEKLAAALNCPRGEVLYYLKRLRFIDGAPVRVERSYFLQAIVPYLGKEIAESSVYTYLTQNLKLRVGFADRQIYAARLSKEDAAMLTLAENDPALVVEEKIYLSNGQIVGLGKGILHFQKTSFFSSAKSFDEG